MHQKNKTDIRYIAVFKSLFRIYAMMVFGISRWQDFIRGKKGRIHGSSRNKQEQATQNFTEAADNGINSGNIAENTGATASIIKTGLFILFLIYIGGCFIVLFRMITINLYRSLQPLGMQPLLFEIEITVLFVFLFISNFLLTLSTYFIGNIEPTLRAMPIPPRIFFGAKFLAHCLPAMIISIAFFAVTAAVYGYYEHSPASFYIMALTGAVFFPLPIIGLCYLINIVIMRTTKIVKQRRFVMMITGVFGIVMALGINYFVQSVNMLHESSNLAGALTPSQPLIAAVTRCLFPVHFFAAALSATSFSAAIGSFLSFIAVCITLPAAIIGLLSGVYEKTLDGFDEQPLKRLTASEAGEFIRNRFTRRSVFAALLLREIHSMNREPAYLLNGPFTIILMPLIYGIMYLTGSLNLPPDAESFMQSSIGLVVAGVCGAFLGSATGIAATAVSRDAKNLGLIKSLPLSIKRYMQAKLAHTMLFAVIGAMIGTGGIGVLFSLKLSAIGGALVIALSLALFCNLLALILDTAHPKLHWDTPAAAVKHNLNTIIMLLSDLLLLSITIAVALLTSLPQGYYLLCFAGIPLLASAITAHFFWRYAEQQINRIEI